MKYEVEEQYSDHLKLIHLFGQSEINMKGAQLTGVEGKVLPYYFLKIREKCHDFGKKYPDCVYL